MTIKVTPDQVDNAKLIMAVDRVRGRSSEEWIVRLANAKPATSTPTDRATTRPAAAPGD